MKKRRLIYVFLGGIVVLTVIYFCRPLSFSTLFEEDEILYCYSVTVHAEGKDLLSDE